MIRIETVEGIANGGRIGEGVIQRASDIAEQVLGCGHMEFRGVFVELAELVRDPGDIGTTRCIMEEVRER